ncbi:hypothetical protein ACFYE9_31330 [Rhizobium leguminosarum]|uniref:Uncharacterized protein n=1 Tax=Rhizobium leguminosarum bv. viciae TaxID=387 RepID=A0A0U3IHJ5_RHILV|nr:hypothetical protein [Rhizobium leguminosarum]ALU64488.1 hypothetical protein [Rhizobium leguminosarum bv. viciae]
MLNPDLHAILGELSAREPLFHHRELGTSREDLLKMTADDFSEIGASGKAYDRQFVIENFAAAGAPNSQNDTLAEKRRCVADCLSPGYHHNLNSQNLRGVTKAPLLRVAIGPLRTLNVRN